MASSGRSFGLRGGGMGLKAFKLTAEESISDEMALRKAEEAASRRFEAARWLRQMDRGALESLATEPSEEEFCVVLRNGLILCNILNRVNPGAVPKVVENPVVTVESTDGAAQSAIQYFENMRNFLLAVGEMKLLTFEASDLEKGGSSIKVVDCILCLKGYHEWKLAGGIGVWRYGGLVKITSSSKGSPSTLLDGTSAELYDASTLPPNQQLLEILDLVTEVSLEESNAANALSLLFDQFGLRLLQAFLTQYRELEDIPLNEMLIDWVLEQAVKEFCMLLVSQRNQLGLLLKRTLKDCSKTISKPELVEIVVRFLKENSCRLSSFSKFCFCGGPANADGEERLAHQQKELEKLKFSFCEMKVKVECSQTRWEEDLKKLEHHMQCLQVNTSSYHKLLEENRLLHNQVQDLKGNIRVYCRVRPFLSNQCDGKSTIDHIGENGSIMIVNPQKPGKDARKIFSFNKVFGANATQNEVFADTQPLIRSVMDGYNVCIFAYGQTGSGKTYTMSGPDMTTEETWGVNYRALNDLFCISRSRADLVSYDVSVQMIEIYNEQVRDLLVAHGSNRRLEIRNNSQLNGLNIPDASLVSVKCTQDVLELMKIGQGNRAVGATALNERSSRSHSVLTVHVQGRELATDSIIRGCLHLVDLAGSERVDKSEATGERLREAQHINRSLSALGDVISALAQKSSHIPYRNSKLTQVLQDALGGQAKTLMFVHINPEVNAFGETISTLKFAERVASVELGAARANKEVGEVRELKEEISKLKSALEGKQSETELRGYYRITLEEQNSKVRSPYSSSSNSKIEGAQQRTGNARMTEEFRSCSSGKQRRPRYSSALFNKELDAQSPSNAEESYRNSIMLRSTSPPLRRSLSTDRAAIIKSKPKIVNIDDRPVSRLQFPDKSSINRSSATKSSALTNRSSSVCWNPQEISNLRTAFSEHEEKQLKSALNVRQGGIRKNMAESRIKSKHQQPFGSQRFDFDSGGREESRKKSNFYETENECSLVESPVYGSPRAKQLKHHMTRISQNVEPRVLVQAVEPLSSGKHENKLRNGAVHNGKKESTDSIEPDFRRSRSLPRGKFTLS
ncbi:kinesin-like protein KIN-14F [Elaeis guineensis]|uniref:Kinesin-like protein KIN-14F n=1 Tax=Elaeis guineensis var. tenera TaxID=51953 RepID=A0A6I9SGG0_ELAGV|nr:kinesin-like protein KIN-14F [Elaeis guineensis]